MEESEKKDNSGCIGCFVILVVLFGAAFLYQREGGEIFGPDGLLSQAGTSTTTSRGRRIRDITAGRRYHSGGIISPRTYEVYFFNKSGSELREVNVKITLKGEKKTIVRERYWAVWEDGEDKGDILYSQRDIGELQKYKLEGKCSQGYFDSTWTTK